MTSTRFYPAITIFLHYPEEIPKRLEMVVDLLEETRYPRVGFEYHATTKMLEYPRVLETAREVRKLEERFLELLKRRCGGEFTETFQVRDSVHAPFVPYSELNLATLDESKRSRAVRVLGDAVSFAGLVHAPVVVAHLNAVTTPEQWSERSQNPDFRDRSLAQATRSVSELGEVLEKTGTYLALENVPYPFESIDLEPPLSPYLGMFPGDFLSMSRGAQSRFVGYCFDACHAWIMWKTAGAMKRGRFTWGDLFGLFPSDQQDLDLLAEEGPFVLFDPLADQVKHLHLAEARGQYTPESNSVEEGNSLDDGELMPSGFFHRVLESLVTRQPRGDFSVVLEVKERDYFHSPNTRQSFKILAGVLADVEK
ncbi:MAG: TIM barrel protein [Promethearchaeota archaeon]